MRRDARFIQMQEKFTPPLNPDLANGVAVKQLAKAEAYVDSVIRSAAKSFPEGVEYLGCERATPSEEYNLITTKGRDRKKYNVARSYLYLMKYHFAFNGEKLPPRYVYLPYVEDAGFIMINNVKYLIMPTLNDIVFSITKDSIFVRLLRDRMRFQRFSWNIQSLEGQVEVISVVWSPIHKKKVTRPHVSGRTTNMHYLLCKYGFTGSFERFAGFKPEIGYDEINYDNYAIADWVIYTSATGRAPRAIRGAWNPTKIRIAIPRKHDTPMTRSMVAGFYYVADHFPGRVKAEWVENDRLWKVLLGHFIEEAGVGEGTLFENMTVHIKSLDQYLDVFVIKQLKGIGYDIQDPYQILAMLMEKFSDWLSGSTDRISSMYDKELNVNYFVLFPITSAIFNTVYRLHQILSTRKVLNKGDVEKAFTNSFTMGKIFRITNSNAEVVALTTPNDNKALRLTSMMIPQSANEVTSSTGINVNDLSVKLHVSIAEVGGFGAMTKKAPDGRRRLNHHLQVDENFRIVRNQEYAPLLDQIQSLIRIR